MGLVWVVGAIVVYPVFQAKYEREARMELKRMGGRYNVDPNPAVDLLPRWLVDYCGGENLYPIRSINLSRCDVADEDLDVLLQFKNLEQVNLCGCPGVTQTGVARLRQLPRLKLIWVNGMSLEDAGRCLTGESMAAAGQ